MDALLQNWPGFIAAVRSAEAGSFSEAARQMNVTPAAVGKSIANLEKQLGVRLFNRTTRRLSMTEEGERVIECARDAMRALAQAGNVATSADQVRGLVRISCAVGFGRRHLMPIIARTLTAYPDLRIELGLSDQNIDLVREGFDIGFRGGSSPPLGMVAQQFCLMTTTLVGSPAYFRRHGTPTHWSELKHHRLIGVRFASGKQLDWTFRSGDKVHVLGESAKWLLSSPDAVVDAALLDYGIGQVGLHHAWEAIERRGLTTVLLDQYVPLKLPLAIYYPHRDGVAPRVRAVVDMLLAGLREDAALTRMNGAGRD